MRKSEPVILGELPCPTPGCNEVAEVRERSNGKRLKYTYCPACKVNQQSGQAFQTFIAENMRPVGTGAEQPTEVEEIDPAQEPDFWRPALRKAEPGAEPGTVEREERGEPKSKLKPIHWAGLAVLMFSLGGFAWFTVKKVLNKPKPAAEA